MKRLFPVGLIIFVGLSSAVYSQPVQNYLYEANLGLRIADRANINQERTIEYLRLTRRVNQHEQTQRQGQLNQTKLIQTLRDIYDLLVNHPGLLSPDVRDTVQQKRNALPSPGSKPTTPPETNTTTPSTDTNKPSPTTTQSTTTSTPTVHQESSAGTTSTVSVITTINNYPGFSIQKRNPLTLRLMEPFNIGKYHLTSRQRQHLQWIKNQPLIHVTRITGHADSIPVQPTADYASNQELSQRRALAARQFLGGSIPIEAYGTRRMIRPGADLNRRVELVIEPRRF